MATLSQDRFSPGCAGESWATSDGGMAWSVPLCRLRCRRNTRSDRHCGVIFRGERLSYNGEIYSCLCQDVQGEALQPGCAEPRPNLPIYLATLTKKIWS